MEQIIIISIVITILYCLFKLVEMKYIEHEMKPVKHVVRDALAVLLSSIVVQYAFLNMGNNVSEFFNILTNSKSVEPVAPTVFTDTPVFKPFLLSTADLYIVFWASPKY